jgi:hypothetical protein
MWKEDKTNGAMSCAEKSPESAKPHYKRNGCRYNQNDIATSVRLIIQYIILWRTREQTFIENMSNSHTRAIFSPKSR